MRILLTSLRDAGVAGCWRKLAAAAHMMVPVVLRGRRTAAGVAAYFDLITDEGRLFYGDGFHFGYFPHGDETLEEALDAHTDLVAEMARPRRGDSVLDVGCGIAAPALRIAASHDCRVTAVNISAEQVRQGRRLIEDAGMTHLVAIERCDARTLPFSDESFDAIVCLEAAADICVAEDDKRRLVRELHRVLRPGGRVGFSDLALRGHPSAADGRVLRSVLYHAGAELITDWPLLFRSHGFDVATCTDIISETMATWQRLRQVYDDRRDEANRRYGKRIVTRIHSQVEQIPSILARHATFPVLAAIKPAVP